MMASAAAEPVVAPCCGHDRRSPRPVRSSLHAKWFFWPSIVMRQVIA
jgi:hypothetical protein